MMRKKSKRERALDRMRREPFLIHSSDLLISWHDHAPVESLDVVQLDTAPDDADDQPAD
jgi:hypothetical protein